MENNKKLIIGVVISIIIGIFIGMGLKGEKKAKKPEIRQVLQSTVDEFEKLERENKELKALVAKSEEKAEADKKRSEEIGSLKAQINKAQLDNKELQSMISQLKSEKPIKDAKEAAMKEISEKYESTLSSLSKENQDLKTQLESAKEEITNAANMIGQLQSEVSSFKEQLKAERKTVGVGEEVKKRITELEKENQELKSIVEGINKMLKGTAPNTNL